jgi:N-acyl-D-amino-acid deacylase
MICEMAMHDLVVRGATLVDGLGHDPIRADVSIRGGRIGRVGKDASEIIDAGGLALMPGIIDLHTHYDAQVTWDPTLSPSPSLGVTTSDHRQLRLRNRAFAAASARPDHA